ncbi:MAG: FAD-dependent oxidoreductase [Myxococcota bacterium]
MRIGPGPHLEVVRGRDVKLLGRVAEATSARPTERKPSPRVDARVLVVGAGPAGLAAALELLRRGVREVVVCEAADHVMGRADSLTFARKDGSHGVGQLGAQMAPESYGPFWRAVGELGLDGEKRQQAPRVTLFRGASKTPIVVDIANPASFYKVEQARGGSLLDAGLWDGVRRMMDEWSRKWHHRLPDASEHWVGEDRRRSSWFRDTFGDGVGDLADAELAALYFKTPEQASIANVASITGCGLRGEHGWTLHDGFGAIGPRAVDRIRERYGAASVRLNAPVTALEETKKGVRATIAGKSESFDYAVLATTSDVAARIAPPKTEEERAVRGRTYTPTVNVILGVRNARKVLERFHDADVYGLINAPKHHGPKDFITSVSFHSGAVGGRVPGVDTVQCMALGDKVESLGLLDKSAEEVLDLTRASLARQIPGLADAELEFAAVVKIPSAIVDSPPGISAKIQAYKESVGGSRIVDAGSHLNVADRVGGAWRSGEAAATAITNMCLRGRGEAVDTIYPLAPPPRMLSRSEARRYDAGAYAGAAGVYAGSVKNWASSLAHGDLGGAASAYVTGWGAFFSGVRSAGRFLSR